MAYTVKNYKTKKALIEDFKAGEHIYVYQPGPFGPDRVPDGKAYIEGPHYPEPHRFYVAVEVKDQEIVKVRR
jgi:hypothetical protein